ncbi:uncharacterized protein OCT59_010371 [Rhizophagus irregularis]|uniref:uncharacterized protein n=1 Tax=Rhizophagus irregularis TaxID=588596 RepID=UPI00331D5512|nr:hypothetical protein OCT59_010371 [Rhizophagus irregularis]
MDEIQHYLMEPLIFHINEVNENSEEEILSAENDELANDDDNIYSDPSDPSEFHVALSLFVGVDRDFKAKEGAETLTKYETTSIISGSYDVHSNTKLNL